MSILKNPMHPGAVLKELYLDPLGIGPIACARALGVPRTRVERLLKGESSLKTDTAMRLAKAFKTTPQFWVNMQANFDMAQAERSADISSVRASVAA
jgi:addiction module HigA family antidote